MEYFKVATEEEALKLSRELYRLTRPNPDPRDVTQFLCEVEETKEGWVLKIPDVEIPISKEADIKELEKIIEIKTIEGTRLKITDIIEPNLTKEDYEREKKEEPKVEEDIKIETKR
jgi:hypothetical protein